MNAFGEEVIVENAEAAITKACEVTGAVIDNFTAAPVYIDKGSKGRHEWIVEFSREPRSLDEFTRVLDSTLRSLNSDYDAKRSHDLALLLPEVRVARPGTFYRWMKQRGKLGGQNKVPRLSNTREYVEEIRQLMQAD